MNSVFSHSRDFHQRHTRPISHTTTLESILGSGYINEAQVKKYIESTHIIVHPTVRQIAKDFLGYKKTRGTSTERHVYDQIEWNVERFFVRLIKQRPLVFYGAHDTTLLRNHEFLDDGTKQWDRVGSDNEHPNIPMKHYLTYEEMMISSLIGVSGYTSFLNDGNRFNRGVLGKPQSMQREGVQVGLVGARFERPGRMDSVYLEKSNPKMFSFERYFSGERFETRYKARIKITIETLLLEADKRGFEAKRRAYVHIVGLGLGVWSINKDQSRWYIEVFTQCLEELELKSIAVLEFAYIDVPTATKEAVENMANALGKRCLFNRRAPSARLEDQSLLLVVSYAWDGNAYPGNEYYLGMLNASGDPAAACSTMISETHNPEINIGMLREVHYLKRIKNVNA